jgi:GT2 family glycosyltransferase
MPGDPPPAGRASRPDPRVTVAVITHNRRAELARTLGQLAGLPEKPAIVVVDNGSDDGSAAYVRWSHPAVLLIAARRNLGAVGRNLALRHVMTPYVAFCDDDTWWEPGSLARAADALDAHPDVAAVTARIVVEPSGEDDPIVPELAHSPVAGRPGLPGPALLSIMAGASVLRTETFRAAGGFFPRLWLGGEEELLCTDLVTAGYWLCYLPQATVHHQASLARNASLRRLLGIRNTLWFTWLRRPARSAFRRTAELAGTVPRDATSAAAFWAAVRGLPWVLRGRRPVPPEVEAQIQLLEEPRRVSSARRYVG